MKSARTRQLVSFLLLILVGHALFVSFTHHHSTQGRYRDCRVAAVAQDSHTPEEHSSPVHEHCVACHLQRNLSALEHSPVFILICALPVAGRESLPFDPHQTGAFLSAAGRAPPLL